MYVPAWQGLHLRDFFKSDSIETLPFPLNAPDKTYFYLARNAIYHLFRAMNLQKGETVLVPAYHSGNEVKAIRAAGARIRYYSMNRDLEPDLDELARLCRSNPKALFVIHYIGWPQPIQKVSALCRKYNVTLIEDCALSFLSETDGKSLGTFGDYAIFCLYKTLPIPNGGVLVQNSHVFQGLNALELSPCGAAPIAGRVVELMLESVRSRSDRLGKALFLLKGTVGHVLNALRVKRVPVGDMGFDIKNVDMGMASFCHGLLKRFDYKKIRERRRENFHLMHERLAGKATLLRLDLEEGVCPLFFPILVPQKQVAARALQQRGISAVEFWNHGDPEAAREAFPDVQFLRDHVLELPIHQDISPSQVEYIADQVLNLKLHF